MRRCCKCRERGQTSWLKIAPRMVREARASGMLLHFNALFEGLAINPAGDQIWLAAERERRGLLLIKRQQTVWDCDGGCVLLSEGGPGNAAAAVPQGQSGDQGFCRPVVVQRQAVYPGAQRLPDLPARCGDGQGRAVLVVCRRSLAGTSALSPAAMGLAEALVVDAEGAWIGIDNNFGARADGENRPIV